ncbi:MAG: HD domain-containing protein [Veillonellaceae bacterium]|nr:HD domain-containing protein [Veillonellaceae bacterium]
MLNRVKQVAAALTAKITDKDRIFIAKHLNEREQKLFWGMNLPDQRHALNVAYSALKLALGQPQINSTILIKSALLHDVGKVKGDVSTIDKILTVIAHKLNGKWAKQWGRAGKGTILNNMRHAFYIYFHHPERSAALLSAINEDPRVVEIVGIHHKAPADTDPPELRILKMADNMH